MSRISRIITGICLAVLLLTLPRWVSWRGEAAELEQMRDEVNALRSRNLALYRGNQRLLSEVDGTSNDRRVQERVAREEFLYVHPDEIILDFGDGSERD